MQTYSESSGKEPFDWSTALDAMIADTGQYDAEDLSYLAASWITCACGNTCAIIPRNKIGEPIDPLLGYLGGRFCELIDHRCYTEAKLVLQLIEERSSVLISEILKKKR